GQRPGFSAHALAEATLVAELGVDQLERDRAIELVVVGEEHLAHAARTEPTNQPQRTHSQWSIAGLEQPGLDALIQARALDAVRTMPGLFGQPRVVAQVVARVIDGRVHQAHAHTPGVSLGPRVTTPE